jgi:hypothetical protein
MEQRSTKRGSVAALTPRQRTTPDALAEADGLRVPLQAKARAQLRAERQPATRARVLRRAHRLLQQHQQQQAVAV